MPPLEKKEDQLLKAQADIRAFTDMAVSHLDSLAAEYRKTNPSISSDFSQAAAKLRKSKDQMYKEFSSAKTTQQKSEILAKYFVYSRRIYSGTLSLSWHDIFAQPERLGGNMLWAAAEGALISCRQSTRGLASTKVALADKNGNVYGEAQLGSVAGMKALDEYKNSKALLESKILEAQSLIRSGKNREAMELMKLIAKKDEEITTRFMKHVSSRAESMAIERRNAGQSGIKNAYNFVFTDYPWAIDAAVLAGGMIFPAAAPASAGYFFGRGATEFALGAMEKNPERAFFGALMALTPAGRLPGVLGKVGQVAGSGLMTFAMLDGAKVTIDAAKYGWTKQDVEALVSNGIFLGAGYAIPRSGRMPVPAKKPRTFRTAPKKVSVSSDSVSKMPISSAQKNNAGKKNRTGLDEMDEKLMRLLAHKISEIDKHMGDAQQSEKSAESWLTMSEEKIKKAGLTQWGVKYLATKDFERAAESYAKALKYDKARELLGKALRICEEADEPGNSLVVIDKIMSLEKKQGREVPVSLLEQREAALNAIYEKSLNEVMYRTVPSAQEKSSILEFFGKNKDVIEKWKHAWFADLNSKSIEDSNMDRHIASNLINIIALELQYPGSSIELYKEFGIRFFGRYSIFDLISQYEHPVTMDKTKPLLMVLFPSADRNGAFYDMDGVISSLSGHFNVVITEAATTYEAVRNLTKANKIYGKISTLMFGGHGSITSATLGYGNNGSIDVEKFIGGGDISRYFIPNPSVILVSCSTGAPEGLAQKAAFKYKAATIYAPSAPVSLAAVHYTGLSDSGTPMFDISWSKPNASAKFSFGSEQPSEKKR